MFCPLCKAVLDEFDDSKYCSHCGQFIKPYLPYLREKNNQEANSVVKQNQNNNKKRNDSD